MKVEWSVDQLVVLFLLGILMLWRGRSSGSPYNPIFLTSSISFLRLSEVSLVFDLFYFRGLLVCSFLLFPFCACVASWSLLPPAHAPIVYYLWLWNKPQGINVKSTIYKYCIKALNKWGEYNSCVIYVKNSIIHLLVFDILPLSSLIDHRTDRIVWPSIYFSWGSDDIYTNIIFTSYWRTNWSN